MTLECVIIEYPSYSPPWYLTTDSETSQLLLGASVLRAHALQISSTQTYLQSSAVLQLKYSTAGLAAFKFL